MGSTWSPGSKSGDQRAHRGLHLSLGIVRQLYQRQRAPGGADPKRCLAGGDCKDGGKEKTVAGVKLRDGSGLATEPEVMEKYPGSIRTASRRWRCRTRRQTPQGVGSQGAIFKC